MERIASIRAAVLPGLLVLAVALLSACAGGVPQADYDAAKQQLTAKEQQATQLQQQLQAAQAAGQGAAALQQQLAAKEKEVEDLKKSTVRPLIWTEVKPTPTPRPPATPVPPGYVAPTPVPPGAAWVDEVIPFTFYVETLTRHQTTDIASFPGCVPNSQFQRGAGITWRFEVVDTSTGKRVTNLDSPTIKVVLPNGQEIASRYSKRGGIGPWMWAAAWEIPKDYPLGTLDYQIVVTKGGRTGTFDQDTLALVRPPATPGGPAVSDSRLQIVP